MAEDTSLSGLIERPFGYAYRYPYFPPAGATVISFGTGGGEVNGSKPIETIPLYSAEQVARLTKQLEEAREALELARTRFQHERERGDESVGYLIATIDAFLGKHHG